jgi:hypothetical protein
MNGKRGPRTLKKKEVGQINRTQILPALEAGFVVHDQDELMELRDEVLLDIVLERSGFGRALYLDALVYPLYAPHDFPALPGTLGGRSNYLFPDTPSGFDMETAEDVAESVEQIIQICRDHLVPFLNRATSSRELLRLHDTSAVPRVFGRGRNDWHYCFLMGFIAAYCCEFTRVTEFFRKSAAALGDHKAYWVAPRLAEMAELERLLDDPEAVRRHLATNAYNNRKLLKLPFPFDPTAYGLPADWQPPEAEESPRR